MKRILSFFLFFLFFLFLFTATAFAEQADDWSSAPVITEAYELSEGKLYLEWSGSAPVYQVYMDGQSVADVIVNNAVISVEKGTHAISIYPINEAKSADTTIDIGVDFGGKLADIVGLNGNLNFDLATLGLDPKNLTAGTPSETLRIDYTPGAIFSATPDKPSATTDSENRIVLTFTDRYNADEYIVGIKAGKDTNYVKFSKHDEAAAAFITKKNTTVTVILDPVFLETKSCLVPELDNKYSLTVQLRKYAGNLLDGSPIDTVIHESKESSATAYTPVAIWKTAPIVTYASQTADGQITLQWTHNDNNQGCQYSIMKLNKKLGVKISEEEIGVVTGDTFVVDDLLNGNHFFTVVPKLNGENGTPSEEAAITVQNDWVAAPTLLCEQISNNQIKLSWMGSEGISTYHITVQKGDNTSLLRFVNMDFSEHSSFDVESQNGSMEYLFTYDSQIDPENGEKFKFEIHGVHLATDGSEQLTSTTSQIITIK